MVEAHNNAESTLDEESIDDLNGSLLGFIRYARENRYKVGVGEALDCQRVVEQVGIEQKAYIKIALKGLMCANADDWERFDRMFDLYWRHDQGSGQSQVTTGGQGQRVKQQGAPETQAAKQKPGNQLSDVADATGLEGDAANDGRLSQEGASAAETTEQTNFKQLNHAAELREMEALAEQLAKRIRRRVVRRLQISQRGKRIDMRRTLRHSLQHGGDPVQLFTRKRHVRVPKLVLMLDVSRSMSVYSYLFLRFARGILSTFKDADAFAFHTRLQNIGETLREQSRVRLIEKMELISHGWNGGTRMDSSLAEFNQHYARHVLNRRTVFVIVSDGYDTGTPEALVSQLQIIKQRVHRVVWINPLLGQESYTPSTRCMQAAIPLVDVFAPGHNLESLGGLADTLAQV